MDVNFRGLKVTEGIGKVQAPSGSALHANSTADDGQTALNAAISKEHLEVVKNLLGGGPSMNKSEARGWTSKALAEQQGSKSICDLLLGYENRRRSDEHRIELNKPKEDERNGFFPSHSKKSPKSRYLSTSSSFGERKGVEPIRKRVTIHEQFQKKSAYQQHGKLISLPDSIDELFKIAGKLFSDIRTIVTL